MDKQNSQILIYQAGDGETKIEVKLQNETVWLNTHQMAELFQIDRTGIIRHIQNVYEIDELEPKSTCAKIAQVAKDGKTRELDYYNLDMIISVGYRVNSLRGTQFRIWATQRLKEYIIKGFTMDDERLKMGGEGTFYFKEWLARIREIRASERNLYDKVKDIFATSIDYNSTNEAAKEFYATVQNKFHFAIIGQTAAEIVVNRIDGAKENLGLTNWKGRTVTRDDVEIAKNYMLERELKRLYLLVEQFLSFAELQIELERPMYMADWKRKLDDFLKLNELEILRNSGKISRDDMETVVKKELERYLKVRKGLDQPK